MWILPSKNRFDMCQKALDAFAEHGSTKGVLWVDDNPYPKIRLPKGWVKVAGNNGAQAGSHRYLFERYPDEPWYGSLADDNYPKTKDFDLRMIEQAKPHYFVSCHGGVRRKKAPASIPSAMVWGGELVRAAGWLCHPYSKRTGIDEVWKIVSRKLKLRRHLNDVIVDHPHPQDGTRPKDKTDAWPPEPLLAEFFRTPHELQRTCEEIAEHLGIAFNVGAS